MRSRFSPFLATDRSQVSDDGRYHVSGDGPLSGFWRDRYQVSDSVVAFELHSCSCIG
jgi:hypothetical protein